MGKLEKLFCPDCGKPMDFMSWNSFESRRWVCNGSCHMTAIAEGTHFFRAWTKKDALQFVTLYPDFSE